VCSVKILLERDIILGILDWQRGDGMAEREMPDKPVVPDVRPYRDVGHGADSEARISQAIQGYSQCD
jgi:hypothetical protein